MKFDYKYGCYIARIRYPRTVYGITKEIPAIFDTGCSITSMSLYSLSFLLNESYTKFIEDLTNPKYDNTYHLCADGKTNKACRITLPSVYLVSDKNGQGDIIEFEQFFCSVSTDVELAKNNGIIHTVVDGKTVPYQTTPYVLIGCDIIHSFNYFNGDANKIFAGQFDKQKYYRKQKEINPHPLPLFKNKELFS